MLKYFQGIKFTQLAHPSFQLKEGLPGVGSMTTDLPAKEMLCVQQSTRRIGGGGVENIFNI